MEQSDLGLTDALAAPSSAYSCLFQDHPLPLWIYDRETLRFLDANKAALRQYGYSYEEFLLQGLTDIRPAEDVPALLKAVRGPMGTAPATGEWRHRRKDGSILNVFVAAYDVVFQDRLARLVMSQDITDRKRIEAANHALLAQIQRERRRLDNLLSRAPAVVWEFWDEPDDSLQRINYVSAYVESLLGYPACMWMSKATFWLSVVHPDDRERVQREAWEQYESGLGGISEYRSIARDGRVVWIEATTAVILDDDGDKLGVRGINIDITPRKQAQEALRQSEERFNLSMEATSDGLWDWNVGADEGYFSPGYYRMLGYEPGAFPGNSSAWKGLIHPDDREHALRANMDCVDGYRDLFEVEYRMKARSGEWRWILGRGKCIARDGEGRALRMVGTHVDITKRKRAEERLGFLAAASETLSASIDYETTLENLTHVLVPHMAEACAIDILEESGATRRVSVAHEDSDHEALLRRRPARYDSAPALPHPLDEVLSTGRPIIQSNITETFLAALGIDDAMLAQINGVEPQSYMAVPLLAEGRVLGALSFVSCRPDRVYTWEDLVLAEEIARRASTAVENARLHREIQRADSAKDEFLAMLGHELRNPLGVISNAMELIRLRGRMEPPLQRTLDVVERQSRHVAHLVDDLLDVSRITRGKIELRKETVDVASIINHAIQTTRAQLQERGPTLSVNLPSSPVWLEADVVRMTQMVINLLNNAVKFTETCGTITVSAERDGETVVIRVRDTGAGISEDMLETVFDLFFQAEASLDRAQGGLGIGLTVVRNLVRLHGGSVRAMSEGPGKGSEFVVCLPALSADTNPDTSSGDAARPKGRQPRLRILLVDDNADAARTLSEILKVWGHSVLIANDGSMALELARVNSADVVLLDIGLPGMNGYEVARQVHDNHLLPGATLVALTGYGLEEDQRRSREAGFQYHLVKPVDFDVLRKLLDELGRTHRASTAINPTTPAA